MHVQALSKGEAISISAPKSRNLPVRILRAFDNAKHIIGLSRGVKDTLAEICRYVKQSDPLAPIFPHKAHIASRIGIDERTVYRHMSAIKEHGLIEVMSQERKSRNGRFAVARIRLTKKAAELLGLIEAENNDIHREPDDNLSDGHTLTEPTIPKKQPATRGSILPDDLKWLTGNGLSLAGVFKLMKIATQKGKRLSDIATACREYLAKLKGEHLFCTLRKLANSTVDYSHIAAEALRREKGREAEQLAKAKAKAFRERFKGVSLTNRSGTLLYQIDSACRFAQVTGAKTGTVPLNDLTDWIAGIETGRLVLATAEREAAILTGA
ncbi:MULTISPECIES: hypothetical protein [unclassified Undibacterium]|uniref:hypothetical protein n=1 Tax=unclassified Undibacterium TaxID=2630295 RepID=UPI003C2FA210